MTGKELKKLGRPQLLELLVAQAKEMEGLKERLAEAEVSIGQRAAGIGHRIRVLAPQSPGEDGMFISAARGH